MKTKEKFIEEAWLNCSLPKKLESLSGYYWFRCKRSQVEHLRDEFDFIVWDLEECSIRPKTLKGIEDNNGWTPIEAGASIPYTSPYFQVCFNGRALTKVFTYNELLHCVTFGNPSHYREYVPIPDPLF